jgi:hypothetical protein
MALTKKEQKAILKSIPAAHKKAVREHVRKLHQSGSGVMDILKSVSNFLGPIISQVGPTVLKEFIIPFIKKMSGNGVELSGHGVGLCGCGSSSSCGCGLKLAGQGDELTVDKLVRVKKNRLVKGSQEAKDHMAKLRAMRKPKKI